MCRATLSAELLLSSEAELEGQQQGSLKRSRSDWLDHFQEMQEIAHMRREKNCQRGSQPVEPVQQATGLHKTLANLQVYPLLELELQAMTTPVLIVSRRPSRLFLFPCCQLRLTRTSLLLTCSPQQGNAYDKWLLLTYHVEACSHTILCDIFQMSLTMWV